MQLANHRRVGSQGAGRSVPVSLVFLTVLLAISPSDAAGRNVREIGPDDNFCRAVNSLEPGDELVLRPGDYHGPCGIHVGGRPGAPIVIRAKHLAQRPRIVYEGRDHNIIEVRTSHVVLRGLAFGPADVDGVRVKSGDDITVEDCRFTGLKGIAIVAPTSQGLAVRRNEVLDTDATAMYFGCHDGTCALSNLTVEGNYIDTVRSPDPQIGYGVQVKLNSVAVIRDNVIVNTKGPGIMVYGSRDPDQVSVVERNFVMGSRTSSGIVVGGGPAVVRNNIAMSNAEAGIGLEDYQRRGLVRNVVVVHNSVYDNALGGIEVPEGGGQEILIANNAVESRSGVAALPPPRKGVRTSGNFDCALGGACFRDPERRDFSPSARLLRAAVQVPKRPTDDFFGISRGTPSTVGALERPGTPIGFGAKR